jgi:hypothetical protein
MDVERILQDQIDSIYEGELRAIIQMRSVPKESGYGFLDDIWDEDGDSIVANSEMLFGSDGSGLVQVMFAQGADPKYVSRTLRKMADMLDGPDGLILANMESRPGICDWAHRDVDGTVLACNLREEFKRMKAEEETRNDDEADG